MERCLNGTLGVISPENEWPPLPTLPQPLWIEGEKIHDKDGETLT